MTSLVVISFLAAHFIGDWLLQPRSMAHAKSSDPLVLAKHVSVVTLVLAIPVVLYARDRIPLLLVNALLHAFIDWNVWSGYKDSIPVDERATHRYWEMKAFWDTVACDQFMHLYLIAVLFL